MSRLTHQNALKIGLNAMKDGVALWTFVNKSLSLSKVFQPLVDLFKEQMLKVAR